MKKGTRKTIWSCIHAEEGIDITVKGGINNNILCPNCTIQLSMLYMRSWNFKWTAEEFVNFLPEGVRAKVLIH